MTRGVLHIVSSLGAGGVEKLVFDLASEQARDGPVYVLKPHRPFARGLERDRVAWLTDQGVEVASFGRSSRDIRGLARGIRIIQARAPRTIIHSHVLGGVVAAGISAPRAPVVFTLHNTQWGIPRPMIAVTMPLVNSYVACGETVASCFQPYVREHIRVIPNGIPMLDFPVSASRPRGAEDSVVQLVAVGSLRPQKNYMRLLNGFARASRNLDKQGVTASLAIVGDGPDRPYLEAEIRRLGIEARVSLEGERYPVLSYLADADMFVMASDHEGMPVALLEAMAVGLPAVITPFQGADDIVRAGVTGEICDGMSGESLATAIERLSLDRAKRQAYGAAAAASVRTRFSIQACARSYSSVYATVSRGIDGASGPGFPENGEV